MADAVLLLRINPAMLALFVFKPGSPPVPRSSRPVPVITIPTWLKLVDSSTNACRNFNEPPVKDLMSVHVDAITGVPSFKRTGVTIEKV